MGLTNRNRPSQSLRRSDDVNCKSLYANGSDVSLQIPDEPSRRWATNERSTIKDVKGIRRSASNTNSDAPKVVQKGILLQRRLEAAQTVRAKSINGNTDTKIQSSPRIKVTPNSATKQLHRTTVKTSTPLSSPRPTPSVSPIMFNGRPKSSGAESFSNKFDFNNRRSSVASSRPSIKKITSFATVGRQVSSIMKFKRSFGRALTIPENVIEVGDEIRELPKSPRFASYLSPEAQFAVMKGYEDVLHREISTKLPQYKPHLRRTKTPNNKIEMKRLDRAGFRRSREDDLDSVSSIYSDDENINYSSNETRRASMPATTNFYGFTAPLMKDRPRAHSSPAAFVPREKRLVLTYRFESAMDILDTLRFQSGCSTISPRVTDNPRKILPLKDFNNWTSVWHNEFETEETKDSVVKAWRT
ncbi:hypothetical protein LOTGIDRAFT_158133 [Lottia gigantea]|uniref:Uncharacterized protein n=1 Tax=Lottia gigantea TaxID=225164 RepID=V4A7P3_LOTGI|nr:hypothetical protein LOTGIDRAFT_158133 [Lottia gigantea]ESO99968.1 hypothetical protein LOTGIDRAFT_158133 [Lottia gigantea]